jgi:hypothetical protein
MGVPFTVTVAVLGTELPAAAGRAMFTPLQVKEGELPLQPTGIVAKSQKTLPPALLPMGALNGVPTVAVNSCCAGAGIHVISISCGAACTALAHSSKSKNSQGLYRKQCDTLTAEWVEVCMSVLAL